MQRGIRDRDTLSDEQLTNLGEAQAITEPALDGGALLETPRPPVAARATGHRVQRQEHLTDVLVADRGGDADAGGRRGHQIPADGFRIEPELGSDPLLRQPLTAEPKDFPISIIVTSRYIHASWPPGAARDGDLYRAVRRKGERF